MNAHRVIVNALTFARVPLIFAWLGFAIAQEFTITPTDSGSFPLAVVAGLMMLLSGLTDMWDGLLARGGTSSPRLERWQIR